jgi:GTP-binding protein
MEEIELRYNRLQMMQEFTENSILEFKPKYVQQGANYFIHTKQEDEGLQLIHYLDYKTMNYFVKGIKADDY